MGCNHITMIGVGICENVLDEIISVLVTRNYFKGECRVDGRHEENLLSMRGMRGRSARPSQTRSRYRSKNSAPPILRHFSTTLEANWSMLYSVAYRRTWSIARLRSEGRPCSQICWMHQFPNWPCATISMLERTSLMQGRCQRKYHQHKALTS